MLLFWNFNFSLSFASNRISNYVKIAEENALPELTSPVSGVILSLMAHLRQCTISTDAGAGPASVFSAAASGKALNVAGVSLPVGPSVAILKGLIEAVLRSGGGLQRVRANLYAALLYFMQTAPDPDEAKDKGLCAWTPLIDHLAVLCPVSRPLNKSDAGVVLALIQTS